MRGCLNSGVFITITGHALRQAYRKQGTVAIVSGQHWGRLGGHWVLGLRQPSAAARCAAGRASAKASRSASVPALTRMQRSSGATPGMRTKMSRAMSCVSDPPREGAVAPAVDGDEVGGGGQRRQPVGARDPRDAVPRAADARSTSAMCAPSARRGERARLGDPVDAEMVADLVEALDQAGLADGVADAGARPGRGPSRRCGSAARADRRRRWAASCRRARTRNRPRRGTARSPSGRRSIRLCTARRVPPRAHGVVGVGEEDEARLLALGQIEERLRVLAVVDVRRCDRDVRHSHGRGN